MNPIKAMPLVVFVFGFSLALVSVPQTLNAQYCFVPYWMQQSRAEGTNTLGCTWVTSDGTTGVVHSETVYMWGTGYSAEPGGPSYQWTDGTYAASDTSYLGDSAAQPRLEMNGIITQELIPASPIVPAGCWILEGAFAGDLGFVPGITATAVIGLRPPDYGDTSCIDFGNTRSQITMNRILPDGTLEPVECVASTDPWASNLFMGTAVNRVLSNQCPTRPIWVEADPLTGCITKKVAFHIEEETSYNADCNDGKPRYDEHHSVSMVERCSHRIVAVGAYPGAPPEWVSHLCYSPIQPQTDVEHGGALNGGDPVDLVRGDHLYLPAPDIAAYNPYGLSALYRRNYSSACAKAGYFSPGLSCGWVDNFDVRIGQFQGTDQQPNYNVILAYPTGGRDTLYAVVEQDGEPTGAFRHEAGRPYIADGVVDSTNKCYTSISVRWKNGTVWTFTPGWNTGETANYRPYWLTGISNQVGQGVSIIRSAGGAVVTVSGRSPGKPDRLLLSFEYVEGGYLGYITDCSGTKVEYKFGDKVGICWTPCVQENRKPLRSVSQLIGQSVGSYPPIHWNYDYTRVRRNFSGPYGIALQADYPLLTKIDFPSPTGTGRTVQRIAYEMDGEGWPRVNTIEDGNRVKSVYEYGSGSATVTVKDHTFHILGLGSPTEDLDAQRTQYLFNAYGDIPTVNQVDVFKDDGSCYSTYYDYSESSCPGSPSYIWNNGEGDSSRWALFGYDSYGNVLSVEAGCRRSASYGYAYTPKHPLGCLVEATENSILKTVLGYDNRGLVNEIYTLKPTAKGYDNRVYTKTSIAYNWLGDISSVTFPRVGADTSGSTTFEYTVSGSPTKSITYQTGPTTALTCDYGADPKVGQPLSISQGGHVIAQFTYDDRGNVQSTTNALGEQIDYQFNVADQIEKIEYPSIATQ